MLPLYIMALVYRPGAPQTEESQDDEVISIRYTVARLNVLQLTSRFHLRCLLAWAAVRCPASPRQEAAMFRFYSCPMNSLRQPKRIAPMPVYLLLAPLPFLL